MNDLTLLPFIKNNFTTLEPEQNLILPEKNDFLEDYEMGRERLNQLDGDKTTVWQCGFDDERKSIFIHHYNDTKKTDVLTGLGEVSDISLAFDHLMRPFLAYVEDGVTKLHWHDNNQTQNMVLNDAIYPYILMNDTRPEQVEIAEVMLFYQKGMMLCCRCQHEKFAIEHELIEIRRGRLWQIGMTASHRLKYVFRYIEYK